MAHRLEQARAAALAVAKGDRGVPVGRRQRMRQHRLDPRQQRLGAVDQVLQRRGRRPCERSLVAPSGGDALARRPASRATTSSATANTRSSAPARIGCMPVKAPNAGSTPTASPNQKHGRRSWSQPRRPSADAGMQVTGQHVGAGDAAAGGGRARSRPARSGSSTTSDAEVRRRVAGAVVVVAAHQHQLERPRARARQAATAASVAGACARAECRKSPRKTIRARAGASHQRRQRRPASRWSCRAAPARRGRESSPPCRCARRRRAACGWRR